MKTQFFVLLHLIIQQVQASCDVFNTISTPDTDARIIDLDLLDQTVKDYGWGVWTKYSQQYESAQNFDLKIQSMHVTTEYLEQNIYMIYYITFDKENKLMYHRLYVQHDNNFQIREMQLNYALLQGKWVFFYFCYSEVLKNYNLFLYINQDNQNVQMVSGGPYILENVEIKYFQLNGLQTISNILDPSMNIGLIQFAGEISDLDQRIGSQYYYPDIPTFLNNINDPCQPQICFTTIKTQLFQTYDYSQGIFQQKVTYIESKFMISGWVQLNQLTEPQTVVSVLMRGSFWRQYLDDTNQGDKALYFQYLQSNQNDAENGIKFTTYHELSKTYEQYQTLETDSWEVYGDQYKNEITFWHWIVYQEGVNDPNNIQLTISFGIDKRILTKKMAQNHFSKGRIYLSIGGDKYNTNFKGQIRNLQFSYCQSDDRLAQQICDVTCDTCFGPLKNHCNKCKSPENTKRKLYKGECKCDSGYLDTGDLNCKPKQAILKNIDIKEQEIIDDSSICQLGEFYVYEGNNYNCLKCPGAVTTQGLYCLDCIMNPKIWYLNPICKTDYLQPKNDDSTYVFLQKNRIEINYEYYLFIKDQAKKLQLELCFGCLGKTNSTINSIERFSLDQNYNFMCKTCYKSIDGNCVNQINNCNQCNYDCQCTQCENYYTLYNNQCWRCPAECPECIYNATGFYCKSCINQYYYNKTTLQCQQCGQFCSDCVYHKTYNFLQCVKCIDVYDYYISGDFKTCVKKTIENCLIQMSEYQYVGANKTDEYQQYVLPIDIKIYQIELPIYSYCFKCERQFINQLDFSDKTKMQCIDVSKDSEIVPTQLKEQVMNQEGFQLARSKKKVGQEYLYTIVYGDSLITPTNNYESIITKSTSSQRLCSNENCIECIKNYVYSKEYCMLCKNGYYANIQTGICYHCPTDCVKCIHQNKQYQDGWKWEIRAFYQYRSSLLHGYHNFNIVAGTTATDDYEILCTECIENYTLFENKCYPKINCSETEIIDGEIVCLKCENESQTFINNTCVECPSFCALCRQLTQSEIFQINPYFNPEIENQQFIKYAKQCLKKVAKPPDQGIIYHDMSLGLEVNCKNSNQNNCYLYLEIPINVYCETQNFDEAYGLLNDEDQQDFLTKNIALSQIFSNSNLTHFYQIESQYLYEELNQKSVKLIRFILNIKEGTGVCKIQTNQFVFSSFRQNVFSISYLELNFISQSQIPFYFGSNITFYQFTKISFKNILIDSLDQNAQIILKNEIGIDLLIDTLSITNNNFNFQIIVQNPQSISISNIKIDNSKILNLDGLIQYYFTKQMDYELVISIQDFLIQNSKIINSQLIVQKLDTDYSNQKLLVTQLQSKQNQYQNSTIFYTQFLNQIRKSQFQIDKFISNQDQLLQSTYCTLHGALKVILQNIEITSNIYQSTTKLFKIPLATISDVLIKNNHFQSNDNTVFTNIIDSLYSDDIKINLIEFNRLQFITNQYVGNKFIMELVSSSNFKNLIVKIDQIILNSNKFVSVENTQQIISQNASLYFDLQELQITNSKIIRSLTLPEFSVNNAQKLTLQSVEVTLNSYYHVKLLHSQLNCISNLSQIDYSSLIQIFNVKNIIMEQLFLNNLISINLPIIIIKSLERTNQRQQENISFSDCQFINNTLIITKLAEQQSVISIVSEQEQYLKFENVEFVGNHQHSYLSDLLFKQSSTLILINPYSNIQLINSIFKENILTNSQGSNLLIVSSSVTVSDVTFTSQNLLSFQKIKDNLIWGYSDAEESFLENLQKVFPIKSKGGNAFISSDKTIISNVVCQNSVSMQGGAFYLVTQSSGLISMVNSYFNNSRASLNSDEKGQGGTFFIDASQASLILNMINLTIQNSMSRKDGGTLFIEPSRYSNQINLYQIDFLESYSLTNALIKVPISFSSSTLILSFTIDSCTALNRYDGYLNFLGLIDEFSDLEIKFMNQIYLFSVESGNISIVNSTFQNIFHYGILALQNVNNIRVQNILIQNITLLSEGLIKIQQNTKFMSNQNYQNLELKKIYQFLGRIEKPQRESVKLLHLIYSCNDSYTLPARLYPLFNASNIFLQALNNFYTIFTFYQKPSFIFGIDSISITHYFSLKSLILQDIKCSQCKKGVFVFSNIEQVDQQNLISINDLQMQSNECGELSCLVFSSGGLEKLDLSSGRRFLNEIDAKFSGLVSAVKIEQSIFESNAAIYGGAILVSKISIIILSCSFINNQAQMAGGGLYFDSDGQANITLYNSFFANNSAKVGGGLYLGNNSINQPKKLNNKFQNNKASFFGDDYADQPIELSLFVRDQILDTVRIFENETNIVDEIAVDEYTLGSKTQKFLKVPSGQAFGEYQIFAETNQSFVPYNLRFRIIPLNIRKSQIKSLKGTKCSIKSRQVFNNTFGEFYNNFTNLQSVEYNTTSQDYNLDQLMIYFDPSYSDQGYLQLEFQCDSIRIPIFSEDPPFSFLEYLTNYQLRVNLKTFACQRGEYSSDKGTCKVCDANADQYTVRAGQRCSIKDQIKMEKVTAARIMLRPGFWRPQESSEKIEYCLNMPENCVGGWDPGNALCSAAHIGALCEQCDMYGIRNEGQYSVSTKYKCGSCKDIGDNTMKIALISFWTMFSIFLSVKGTVETVEKMVTQYKFAKFKIFAQDPKAGYGSVLIKVMTNYLQIIGAVSTFQLQLPGALQTSIRSVGNPVESMSFSLDCFLVNLVDINIIYFRMIWALIMPMIYLIIFLLLYSIAIIIRLTKPNKSAITTTLIYLFTYLQPTLLEGFIALLSFRIISDTYWIQGNVAYIYNTQQHFKWVLTFILPSTLSLAIVIPAYMFISLYNRRFELDQESTRKSWGYLYNEYQIKAYFWEIVKVLEKGFMIIFLTFYEDLIIIKGALIFMIIFVYQLLTKQFRPYKLPFLNFIDELSALICGTSIVMGMTIYQANKSKNQEIIWPFYILLMFINGVFILIILWEIVQAQLEDQQQNLDKVRDKINLKYPDLQNQNWFCKKLFTNRGEQQRRVRQRFQMIRTYLMNIVHLHPHIYSLPASQFQSPMATEGNVNDSGVHNQTKVFPSHKYLQLGSNAHLRQ